MVESFSNFRNGFKHKFSYNGLIEMSTAYEKLSDEYNQRKLEGDNISKTISELNNQLEFVKESRG